MEKEQSNKWTELHQAAGINHTDRIQELTAAGADVNARDEYGNTPLHIAGTTVAGDAFRLLVERGADPEARNSNGDTPLDSFARACRAMAAAAQVGIMDNPQVPEENLHRTISMGETDMTRLLIEHGADVNARDRDGETPLHRVARSTGYVPDAKLLLDHGADVNARDNAGSTPLQIAYGLGRRNLARLLLDHGADIETLNLGIPEIDGGKLADEALAEKPRLEAEDAAWQEKYNTPRATETQETQATEQIDLDEQGNGEDGQSGQQNDTWTNRNRPGL